MAAEQEEFRDWHRLFGLLLTDYFTDSPFAVDVERDLSVQQQLLDVVIVSRGRGRFSGRLPDGLVRHAVAQLGDVFNSRHEALDAWGDQGTGPPTTLPTASSLSDSLKQLLPDKPVRPVRGDCPLPAQPVRQIPWHKRQAGGI